MRVSFAVVVSGFAVVCGCGPSGPDAFTAGAPAPDFQVDALEDHAPVKLAHMKGKVMGRIEGLDTGKLAEIVGRTMEG